MHGVGLGHALIKRASAALSAQFPSLSVFSTLSPMPGFGRWLNAQIDSALRAAHAPLPAHLLTASEIEALNKAAPASSVSTGPGASDAAHSSLQHLRAALSALQKLPPSAPFTAPTHRLHTLLQPILTRLGTHYLLCERRPSKAGAAAPVLDPVEK